MYKIVKDIGEINRMEKENKMGVMPVNKLLISMSAPIMISMLVQALYNVVDSIFVANLSENALTAVSLAFPAQNLIIAVAVGTCVGMNALLSKSLGEKNMEKADRIAENGVFVMLMSYIVFLIMGIFLSRPFYYVQTGNAQIAEDGIIYTTICLTCSFGVFMQICFERTMQATGKTVYTMYTQGLGAIINIILDPIFIFGLLGAPKMGVAGAAAATVIGQICAAIVGFILNQKVNKEIKITLKGIFKPDAHIIKEIYMIGIPSVIMQSIGSVMCFGMNKILIKMTETAAAVFGAYFKLQSFVFMPVFGLNNGMIPILGYNYGARKADRIKKTIKLSVVYAISFMAVGLVIMQLIPDKLLGFFNASEHMLSIGVPALRIISLSFVFAGYCIVLGSVFQAFGHAWLSMIVSITRQIIVILPVAWALSLTGNVNAVWWSIPIAEIASLTLSTFFYIWLKKTLISKL